MTDNEINIEIFKTQGGKLCPIHLSYGCCGKIFPDYCHDWNATHAVINGLTVKDRVQWLVLMDSLTGDSDRWYAERFIQATQRQWCEAYLRVKGLWQQSTSATTKGVM